MTGSPRPIRRLLVANRGEIARRVERAARALGIETVAVFAEDDRGAPHVTEADRAVSLGGGPVAGTYLSVDRIVDAAITAGADAVHPGYGFLSEDPRLARACLDAGVLWVGPPPEAMATMGHKALAKSAVAAVGVPVLEDRVVGDDVAGDEAALGALGEEVGFPLLVKASAGGGGRGMRLVEDPRALADAVQAARREALVSFGSPDVFLERYVVSPRHVEVQVVADAYGRVIHLYDRECSIQRRHQKVLEEAPASRVPIETRRVMWQAAVAAAQAVHYEGVGTVEFIVGGPGDATSAFLEMNTRLQVEHGITELVTGVDLVVLQLRMAAGEPLEITQDDVALVGHAIEVRLCAERPSEDYRPAPGPVLHARWPRGEGVRVDAGVETGSSVTSTYDSLVAKIMAAGPDRGTAIARLRAALAGSLELDGLETNRDMLAAVLDDATFRDGRPSTDFLDTHPEVVRARPGDEVCRLHAAAAGAFVSWRRARSSVVPGSLGNWRNVGLPSHVDCFEAHGLRWPVSATGRARTWELTVDGVELSATVGALGADGMHGAAPRLERHGGVALDIEAAGVVIRHRVRAHASCLAVSSPQGQTTFTLVAEDAETAAGTASGEHRAPLPGSVVRVLVNPGDTVEEGEPLIVLEAMKMEHTLRAGGPGTVGAVCVQAGRQVDAGALLVVVEPR
ncbi:MAG: ATP-grasp domain-containing protein [Actinomycetota bacterium]|nr:ATP-grasp domain-containing protein [Actinomycetota bacterium]